MIRDKRERERKRKLYEHEPFRSTDKTSSLKTYTKESGKKQGKLNTTLK